jgi:transposase
MNRSAERVYCVDLAKDKFQVNGYSRDGVRLRQKSLKRSQFDKFFSVQYSAGTRVVMEACGSSHYWARQLASRGYEVKLVPPQFVAKQRIGNKNDGNDADGIHAVDRDARVRPVPVKTLEQQDLSAAHRLRDLWVRQRTASINQMRGLLAERGCVSARGERGVEALLKRLDQPVQGEITPALVELLRELKGQIADLDARIAGSDRHLAQVAREHPVALQVDSIRGVGPVIATAVVAKFGKDVSRFADARQFAASLGVTPTEHASGQKQYLGSITKRGDPYLRRLLVQGAQSVVRHSGRNDDPISQIARRLLERKPRNAVVVAIANRLARIIYAVIKHGTPYRYGPAAAHA